MVRKGPCTVLGLVEGESIQYICPLYSWVDLESTSESKDSIRQRTCVEWQEGVQETMGHVAKRSKSFSRLLAQTSATLLKQALGSSNILPRVIICVNALFICYLFPIFSYKYTSPSSVKHAKVSFVQLSLLFSLLPSLYPLFLTKPTL